MEVKITPKMQVRIETQKTLKQIQKVLDMNGDIEVALLLDDAIFSLCNKNSKDHIINEYLEAGKTKIGKRV